MGCAMVRPFVTDKTKPMTTDEIRTLSQTQDCWTSRIGFLEKLRYCLRLRRNWSGLRDVLTILVIVETGTETHFMRSKVETWSERYFFIHQNS